MEAEQVARNATDAARKEEAAQRAIAEQRRMEAEKQRTEAQHQRQQAEEHELTARRRLYASQISLANQAWEEGDPAQVLEILEGQRPRFGQRDLRTFEWYYLLARLARVTDAISSHGLAATHVVSIFYAFIYRLSSLDPPLRIPTCYPEKPVGLRPAFDRARLVSVRSIADAV